MQQFRRWARRAPTVERVISGVAALTVVALACWAIVGAARTSSQHVSASASTSTTSAGIANQSTTGPGSNAATGGAIAGQPADGERSRSAGSVLPGPSGGGAAAPATAQGCVPSATNTPGVTATQIRIAITIANIAGAAANQLFGIPSADEARATWAAVIDDINKGGGVACRKLVAQFYETNPGDPNSLQQQCLDIVASGVFALIDSGSYGTNPAALNCVGSHRMAFFGAYWLSAAQQQRFYPYLFSTGLFDRLYRDTAFALKDRGFFRPENGFKKLGFVYRDCFPEVVQGYLSSLRQAGLKAEEIVTYDVGCPSVFASPSDIQQAVLTFRSKGVTHVTMTYFVGDLANFTKVAQQQGFRPKYGVADDGIIAISYGNLRADPNNFADAITITGRSNGEERTPGMTPGPGTARCDTILKSHGARTTYAQLFAGDACSLLWMFKAAADHAPSLQREALAAGLQRAKSVELSYPQGPNDFTGDRVTYGGQFWRVAQYMASCTCWQVVQRDFRPGYK